MVELPQGVPSNMFEAFAHIAAQDSLSADHLKALVLLEAAGQGLYGAMADKVGHPEVKALLERNGREEVAHAHRMSRAVAKLTGHDYPVPAPEENPYLTGYRDDKPVTVDRLLKLAEGEVNGEALYEKWASNCAVPDAAALMRQNGKEEGEHGGRLQRAAALLG